MSLSDFIPGFLRERPPPSSGTPPAASFDRTQYGVELQSLRKGASWCVDDVVVTDSTVRISGWLVPPPKFSGKISFLVNGRVFDQVTLNNLRKDIEQLFWYAPGATSAGFVCEAALLESEKQGKVPFCFVPVEESSKTRLPHTHEEFYLAEDRYPIPDEGRRRRVHGGPSEIAFRLVGYSTFRKLEKTLKDNFGKTFRSFDRILDWGCGCGRVTRYLGGQGIDSVTGVDIDRNNVRWCQENLPFGNFSVVPLRPPTTLPSASFNLIFGISVFTHLKELEQQEWLKELHRIAAPGAVVLMSALCAAGVCRANLPPELFRAWKQNGFCCLGSNFDLGDSIEDSEYYQNTVHSRGYIERVWGDYFTVVDVLEEYVGNHQDLVVMVKK